jgi:hypothetical protein
VVHVHYELKNEDKDVLGLLKEEIPKSKIYEVFGPMASNKVVIKDRHGSKDTL